MTLVSITAVYYAKPKKKKKIALTINPDII